MSRPPSDTEHRSVDDIQQKRWLFLRYLYDDARNTPPGQLQNLPSTIVVDALGLHPDEGSHIEEYLAEKGLIECVGFGSTLRITSAGIDVVEQALLSPESPTRFFPAINVMNISGGIHHSLVQQGAVASPQSLNTDRVDTTELRTLLLEIRSQTAYLDLASASQQELESDLRTIEVQIESPSPKKSILRESLGSAQRILEGAGGSFVAAKIAEWLAK
jgi:hypothetical protein